MSAHSSVWFTAILVILAAALALQVISSKVKTVSEDKVSDASSTPITDRLLLEFQLIRPTPQSWKRFDQCLEFLNKLYGGETQSLSATSVTIRFAFDTEGEAQFQALCTAILAHQINDDLLDFSVIREGSGSVSLDEEKRLAGVVIESVTSMSTHGIVVDPAAINSTVESRLRAEVVSLFNSPACRGAYRQIPIDCLQSKYADLLARQQEQMKRIGRA